MIHLQQEDNECFLTSFAMVLDCTVNELREEVGSTLLSPLCFLPSALKRGYTITTLEHFTVTMYGRAETVTVPIPFDLCKGRRAVIAIPTQSPGGHAVAWDGEQVYNPRLKEPTFGLPSQVTTVYLLFKVEQPA